MLKPTFSEKACGASGLETMRPKCNCVSLRQRGMKVSRMELSKCGIDA